MDTFTFVLTSASIVLLAIASVWAAIAMARTSWWWLGGLLLVIPFFVYVGLYPRRLKTPALLLATALVLQFATLVAAGDLIVDRHPDEPSGRTLLQRAFGCSGSALWSELIAGEASSIGTLLREFRLGPEVSTGETGIARVSVFASALSYLPAEEIVAIASSHPSFSRQTVITEGPYQALVLANDRLIVVAFRGTDNTDNWTRNFKAVPTRYDFGRVHAGFLEGHRTLSAHVMKAVAALHDDQAIVLTGHSLGGALAMLAAPQLQAATTRVERVVTFGQPPVGYSDFAEAWETRFPKRLLRYVNHRDMVVSITGPIALPWTSLVHTGEVRYFDTAGVLHTNGSSTVDLFRDAVCAPTFESGAEYHAHYIRRYLTLVKRVDAQ